MERRVVVTGMGIVSPIGIGKEAFWQSLITQRICARQASWMFILLFLALASLSVVPAVSAKAQENGEFDLVLAGGRVMDPESGLDGVQNIGIRGGRPQRSSERHPALAASFACSSNRREGIAQTLLDCY